MVMTSGMPRRCASPITSESRRSRPCKVNARRPRRSLEKRIDTGLKKHKLGRELPDFFERRLKRGQISFVICAIRQFHVESAGLLVKGKVPSAMYREREDAGIAAKDGSGSISLMNVEIDDGCTLNSGLGARPTDGDGEIVEDAEAGARIAEGMMRSTGEGAAKTRFQSRPSGQERAACACERSGYQPGDQGKPIRRITCGSRVPFRKPFA